MPELPEVETIKTAISHSIGKCVIKDLIIRNGHLRQQVPDDMPQKIIGAKISDYTRIAKYIVIKLDNGLSIVWHLGMSGKVKISNQKPNPPEKHDHILMQTENGWLIFNDARRFGLFCLWESDKIFSSPWFGKIGMDPFDKQLTATYLFEKLQKRKTPIKVVLLDQEIITGIGNIYASESLFRAHISPERSADKITHKECQTIIESVREVLKQAIEAGGSTLKDYQKPDGSLGYFQNLHCVYNKIGQRCPCCNCDVGKTGGIKKIVQAGRSTFYCPSKQH